MASGRDRVPRRVRTEILLANRHACCVCQKTDVQIHHIDGDRSNNALENLAVLCLRHHDLATMRVGLTAKLSQAEVRAYKQIWEAKCKRDVMALARSRVNVYAVCYKNPPRIRQLFVQLTALQRVRAVDTLAQQIPQEENYKAGESMYQWQHIPRTDKRTVALLRALKHGELWPSCVPRVPGHPKDPDYPIDLSPPHGMTAFHMYDLYCQLMVRALLLCLGAIPLEDILALGTDLDGRSVTGRLTVFNERLRGRNVRPPDHWRETPVGTLRFQRRVGRRLFQGELLVKTMYIFSDTSAFELKDGRASGVGVLQAIDVGHGTVENPTRLRIVPLMLGLGQIPVDLLAD